MSTLGNWYRIVKAFWIDFLNEVKRIVRNHGKAIKVLLISSLIVFVIMVGVVFKLSETSTFCGSCHQMTGYIESWKASSHRHVTCTKCHYEPGFSNHLKGKWVDGQVSLAYFISGKRPSKPHAEISDASCLQKGCHKIEDLQGDMIYKNVAFSHGQHLGELRRGMKLRCTSCHAQLVQGKHLTVHETNCFICHYFKAGAKGEEDCLSCPVGGCTSCHIEPKGDINVKGWNFNHRKYIARGVACERCHLSILQGDGHVPEGKCVECHNEPELLTTKYTSVRLHKNHVTDHKIECSSCHTALRHEIGQISTMSPVATACDICHGKAPHLGPRDLYRGNGGIGVPDSPSLMFTTNVDCIACHRRREESHAALHTTKYAEKAIEGACVDCHGPGFDESLRHWRGLLSKTESETNQRLFTVQNALFDLEKTGGSSTQFKKAQHLLNEARHNYSLVLLGKGVHNIEYAFRLLSVASNKTEQALATMDPGHQPREFRTEMTCTTLCHVGIEKRSVPFNEIQFSHETHSAGLGMKCNDCHSPRESHGKTYLKNCAQCHHGREIKKVSCEECHVAVKKLLQGKGGLGVKDTPSVKLNATKCTDCHTGTLAKRKDPFETLQKRCIKCHDESYGELAADWKSTSEDLLKKTFAKMQQVREQIRKIERDGEHTFVYRRLFGDAEFNFNLAKQGNGVHNLEYTKDLLEHADRRLDEALRQLAKKKQEVSQKKM
jgi:nitrate/TMAO reductase-like tetraheme cytochrome c subunit